MYFLIFIFSLVEKRTDSGSTRIGNKRNTENHGDPTIHCQNHENHKKKNIPRQNQENQ